MTSEEAIKRLSDIRADYSCFDDDERPKYHALSMAIEALKERTEAVTDCISRERAIEIVKRAETKEIAYVALINLEPKEIPTCDECRLPECLADKQNDWIPVSERLPEGDDDVLVTVWWGYGKPEVWAIDYAGVTRGAEEGQIDDEKILAHILAWMPLPEPYKGGDDLFNGNEIKIEPYKESEE